MAGKIKYTEAVVKSQLDLLDVELVSYEPALVGRAARVSAKCKKCGLKLDTRLSVLLYERGLGRRCRGCVAFTERSKMIERLREFGFEWVSETTKIGVFWVVCLNCGKKSKKASGGIYSKNGCMGCRVKKGRERLASSGDYSHYYRIVRAATLKNVKKLKLFDLTLISRGSFHIDHIRSVLDCFLDGLSPEQAAHPANLRILSAQDNLRKSDRSDKTKEELLREISSWGQ